MKLKHLTTFQSATNICEDDNNFYVTYFHGTAIVDKATLKEKHFFETYFYADESYVLDNRYVILNNIRNGNLIIDLNLKKTNFFSNQNNIAYVPVPTTPFFDKDKLIIPTVEQVTNEHLPFEDDYLYDCTIDYNVYQLPSLTKLSNIPTSKDVIKIGSLDSKKELLLLTRSFNFLAYDFTSNVSRPVRLKRPYKNMFLVDNKKERILILQEQGIRVYDFNFNELDSIILYEPVIKPINALYHSLATMEVLEETFDRKEIEVNNENIAQIGLMDNYLAVMFTEATHANFRFALYSLTDYKKCLEKTFYTPLKDAMFLKNYIAINTSLGIEVLEVSEDE